MLRLAPPGHGRLEFAKTLEIDVGLNHARAVGFDVSNVLFEKFDGVGRPGVMHVAGGGTARIRDRGNLRWTITISNPSAGRN